MIISERGVARLARLLQQLCKRPPREFHNATVMISPAKKSFINKKLME